MPERLREDGRSAVLETPARQVRVWHNRIYSFLSKHHLNLATAALLGCSLFFFLSIQPVRNRALSSNPELFQDGEMVTITRVIDGDEVRVQNDRGSTRMRLLGIQSFNDTARDLVVSEWGRVCVEFIKSHFQGQQARLRISPRGIDGEGRLLGSLYLQETGEDVALELVRNGMTQVYVRYDFTAMPQYLTVEREARAEGRGLWGSEGAARRAAAMANRWEMERLGEEPSR